jgi:aspartate/methionine/tyrosine aminotransferase
VSGTSAAQQIAAAEALNGPQDEVDRMVEEFRARRDLIVDGLNAIPGISCLRPAGAFYVFPDVSGTGMNGSEMADRLLYDAGVSCLSGAAFGAIGANHLRISYANSRENISLALDRIRTVVEPLAAARV